MKVLTALPSTTPTGVAGQSVVLIYLVVATAAARAATTVRRRGVALAKFGVMMLLLGHRVRTEPLQVGATIGLFTVGLAVELVRLASPKKFSVIA